MAVNSSLWCEQDHLLLNVAKRNKLVVGLRRAEAPLSPVSIQKCSVWRGTRIQEDTLTIKLDGLRTLANLY